MRSVLWVTLACLAAVFIANRVPILGLGVPILVAITIVVVSLGALVLVPGPRPLVPLSALGQRSFLIPTFMSASGMGTFGGLLVTVPLTQAQYQGLDDWAWGCCSSRLRSSARCSRSQGTASCPVSAADGRGRSAWWPWR